MTTRRKVYRIEEMIGVQPDAGEAAAPGIERDVESSLLRELLSQHKAAMKLKGEIDTINHAISATKREIATLSERGIDGYGVVRVAHELDAVVAGTEEATLRILEATEEIEQTAHSLSATLKSDHEQGMAEDIQDRTTAIFEACNFHDLTGQRIGKVVQTLRLLEAHIHRMSEIWQQIESRRLPSAAEENRALPANSLLNGPMLPGAAGHSSQAEIDEIFAASWSVNPAV